MTSIRKHADGASSDHSKIPEPSFAERARTLTYSGRIGSLSTLSRKQPGFPFGSVMTYGLDEQGRPSFLISTMAMHTNLKVTLEPAGLSPRTTPAVIRSEHPESRC